MMHWSWIDSVHCGAQTQNRENNPMQSRMGPGSQRSCGSRGRAMEPRKAAAKGRLSFCSRPSHLFESSTEAPSPRHRSGATAMRPATASSASPARGSRAQTAGATSASKMSRSRRQKGGCEAAFFMPGFGHRLSFRRVATNHHPLSKFNIERESF
jgi:hypothetical protein